MSADEFPILLIKQVADDAIEEIRRESRIPEPTPTSSILPRKAVEVSNDKVIKASEANPLIVEAIRRMEKAADDADGKGLQWQAQSIRQELALLKLELAEKEFYAHGSVSRWGPGTRDLFAGSSSTLPEDRSIGGI